MVISKTTRTTQKNMSKFKLTAFEGSFVLCARRPLSRGARILPVLQTLVVDDDPRQQRYTAEGERVFIDETSPALYAQNDPRSPNCQLSIMSEHWEPYLQAVRDIAEGEILTLSFGPREMDVVASPPDPRFAPFPTLELPELDESPSEIPTQGPPNCLKVKRFGK